MGPSVAEEVLERLQRFSEQWLHKIGNEQQLSQPFLMELCEALGTSRPYVGDEILDYAFER